MAGPSSAYHGHGFSLFEEFFLVFGTVSTDRIVTLSDSVLVCSVPSMQASGDIRISAVVPSMPQATFGSLSFLILKMPVVLNFYPRFAYPTGNFII